MKIWEITQNNNVTEDATAGATDSVAVAGATDSVAVAGAQLAFPLFGDPKKARKAVDPYGYTTPKKKKKKFKPYTNKVKSIFPQ